MGAIKNADAIDWPRRTRLIDMYEDITTTDTHVMSVVEKYVASVLEQPLQFLRRGKEDDRIKELIESPWFWKLLEDFVMEPWTGVGGSLFQFYRDGEWLKYDRIAPKHVDATRRVVMRHQTDLTGVSWDEFPNLLHIGDARQIGKFAAIVYWVIVKRDNVGDWLELGEIFGRPLTDATYDAHDTEARQRLEYDLMHRGSMTAFIHPENTNLKLLEASGLTGGANLYERLHVIGNSEISKAMLGNTLSTEVSDKGTQGLGIVQHEDQETIINRARRRILHILNYELTDILQNFGYNTRGGKFLFVPTPAKNLVTDIQVDQGLVKIGVPLDDDYFYEYYGRPKPKNYDELKAQRATPPPAPTPPAGDPGNDDDPNPKDDPEGDDGAAPKGTKGKTFKNRLSGFFAGAPGKGALEW
jgi:hypothetical protein